MPGPTSRQLRTILLGSELGGDPANITKVTLAIRDAIFGKSRSRNNSGFSFGTVQLDIGSNSYAKEAFQAVLDKAVAA